MPRPGQPDTPPAAADDVPIAPTSVPDTGATQHQASLTDLVRVAPPTRLASAGEQPLLFAYKGKAMAPAPVKAPPAGKAPMPAAAVHVPKRPPPAIALAEVEAIDPVLHDLGSPYQYVPPAPPLAPQQPGPLPPLTLPEIATLHVNLGCMS